MKTKLLTLAAITVGILSMTSAHAATCANGAGTVVTAKDVHEYCMSGRDYNWWSAYAWCEAQGRRMPSIYELCPDWDGSMGSGKCSNTTSEFQDYLWVTTAYRNNHAFRVTGSGGVVTDNRTVTINTRALCY